MKRFVVSVVLCSTLAVAAAFAQAPSGDPLTDAEVAEAIRAGSDSKWKPVDSETAKTPFGQWGIHYDVRVEGPLNVIEALAQQRKREYKELTVADIAPELRRRLVRVVAEPKEPQVNNNQWYVAPVPTNVVWLVGGKPTQPVSAGLVQRAWTSNAGLKMQGAAVVAYFDAAAVMPLPAKFEIVVTSAEQERKAEFSGNALKRIR